MYQKEMENMYLTEIIYLIKSHLYDKNLQDLLSDYHENDIAEAFENLSSEERKNIYPFLEVDYLAEIISYMEDAQRYIAELPVEQAASILSSMDSDDAVDILENMEGPFRKQVVAMMDPESREDIRLILSYDEDEIGSKMTTNYIEIKNNLNIREAIHEVVRQAGENDNIMTVYVTDEDDKFFGAIELKDLIIAREYMDLSELITTSYPYLYDREEIDDCIERIKDYAEDSLPVLDVNNHILGIITAQDIIEVVDDELGEDYAKLAGLTAEEDLKEKNLESMKKRLPWLIALLFLGMLVSSVVGFFESVVARLSIIMCFQSLILGMAGNVGTQSLAVTIRVLMDENLKTSQKFYLVFKEVKVGFFNGMLLAVISTIFVGFYIAFFKHTALQYGFLISGCVGFSLMVAMIVSSLVGTVVPMFFHKINVDPAVASGPLITTVNDLVAVITYYGLAWILLINLLKIG